ASTAGFPSAGYLWIGTLNTIVQYTGTSGGNTFTGCTGGSGTMATGYSVRNDGMISVHGKINIESNGLLDCWNLIQIENGAFSEVVSGGTILANAGSIVSLQGTNTFAGSNTLSGSTTQSNATYTKTGNNAYTVERVTTVSSSGTTINWWHYDLV